MRAETLCSFWSAEAFGLELSHNAVPAQSPSYCWFMNTDLRWGKGSCSGVVLLFPVHLWPPGWISVDRLLLGWFPLLPFLSVCGSECGSLESQSLTNCFVSHLFLNALFVAWLIAFQHLLTSFMVCMDCRVTNCSPKIVETVIWVHAVEQKPVFYYKVSLCVWFLRV